ncbi:hypothetical protein K502DRAFT_325428 [Neoconidiobolus thromboides FSU 785]|nr:hypothetical protein K502DRAFT_325428 [Neoconidiobolus thromboides FSU 785]
MLHLYEFVFNKKAMFYFYFLFLAIATVKSVCFYVDADQQGERWCQSNKGCYNVPDWFNDEMTSWGLAYVEAYTSVIYADADCQGDKMLIPTSQGNVPNELNDRMTSLKIIQGRPRLAEVGDVESNPANHNVSMTTNTSNSTNIKTNGSSSKVPL